MKVVIGADNCGCQLKDEIKKLLQAKHIDVEDVGVLDKKDETPYYSVAGEVAKKVLNKKADRGILCCGTGMGMAIIANKYPGVYAALCENAHAAEKSRSINNSNVLTLGESITTPEMAREIVDVWLNTEFAQGFSEKERDWLHNSMVEIVELEKRL